MAEWLHVPEEYILTEKPKLTVTLYGSYDYASLTRLEGLQNCLRSEDYKPRLVKNNDYPAQMLSEDPHVYNLRKSKYWLESSNVNIIVFFPQVSNDSVVVELTTLCDLFRHKVPDSCVFFHKQATVRSLVEGIVKSSKIYHEWFSKDNILCIKVSSWCLNLLKRKYYEIVSKE